MNNQIYILMNKNDNIHKLVKEADSDYDAKKITNERPVYTVID